MPDPKPEPTDDLITEAQRLLRDRDLESAFSLLEAASERDPDRLDLHGYMEMVRSELIKGYRETLGSGRNIARPKLAIQDVMKFNLPPEAGFLLSLIDGNTSLDQLLSVSGFDEFRTLRVLSRLLEAGIVEVDQ